jgi:hypothetical protein
MPGENKVSILLFLCIFNGLRFKLICLVLGKSVADADMDATLMGHATLPALPNWKARAGKKEVLVNLNCNYLCKSAKTAQENSNIRAQNASSG